MQTQIRTFQWRRERLPYCTVIPRIDPKARSSRIKGVGILIYVPKDPDYGSNRGRGGYPEDSFGKIGISSK